MNDIPQELNPTTTIRVDLPSGKIIQLPCCQPKFPLWSGPLPSFTFGNKQILKHKEQPIFAELLILDLLKSSGCEGVWVSSYGGIKFLTDMPKDASLAHSHIALHDNQSALLERIWTRAGQRSGCFDIFSWRDNDVLFCEAKRHGKDKLTLSQHQWIECAIREGVPLTSLLVCDWSISGEQIETLLL